MRTLRIRPFAALLAIAAIAALPFAAASPAAAAGPGQVVITEWMYNPTLSASEFVEITNIGSTSVDLSTYSFDDDSRTPGSFSLATLGSLAPGESGLIAESTATAFRTEWRLGSSVKVAGSNANNLGRADEVNIFNGSTLVDRLTYGDQTFAGSIRTAGKSGVPTTCLPLGANNVGAWVLSAVGDGRGTVASVAGDLGSPGTTPLGSCGPVAIVGGNGTGNASTLPCQPEAATGTGPSTAGAQPWPGSSSVSVTDLACAWKTSTGPEGRDVSGLVFDPVDPNVLWAVKNKSWVFRLVKQNGVWASDTANGWSAGKQIFFPGGVGQPDSEGLTVGPDGALYITTERDNAANTFSLNSVLRYDASGTATTLSPTQQWNLTTDFPELVVPGGDKTKANLGFEGVTYVPDSFLVHHHFSDQNLGKTYDPADYPGHGAGLFFAALENDGKLYAYALNADGTHQRVAVADTGMGHVMDVQFDVKLQRIWALCDNTCSVTSTLLKVDGTGAMVPDAAYARPSGLPNVNLEGFAIAPESTCASGFREVVWSDDGLSAAGYEGHALYSGTYPCGLGDVDAPTVTAQVSTTGAATFGVYSGPVSVALDADDPGSGVHAITWHVTGADAQSTTTTSGSQASVAISAIGTSSVRYAATDEAGNTSSEGTLEVTVDPRPVVSIADGTSVLEADYGGQRGGYFQISLSAPSPTPVTVAYYTRNGSATACTSTSGCDYLRMGTVANQRTATIPAGSTQLNLSVNVNTDSLVEGDETFDLVLASASSNARLASTQSVGTATIVDADSLSPTGAPILLLTPKNDVVEGDAGTQKGQVIISLSKPLSVPITVTYYTQDDTAHAPGDYRTIKPYTVTIPAGTISKTIDVAVYSNTRADGNRRLYVRHDAVVVPSGVDLVQPGTWADVTIVDDDALI